MDPSRVLVGFVELQPALDTESIKRQASGTSGLFYSRISNFQRIVNRFDKNPALPNRFIDFKKIKCYNIN